MGWFCFSRPSEQSNREDAARTSKLIPALITKSPLHATSRLRIENASLPTDNEPLSQSDILSRLVDGEPLQTSLEEIHKQFDGSDRSIFMWKFSRLEAAGETLTDHVKRKMERPEGCIGPASEQSLVYKSQSPFFPVLGNATAEQARSWVSKGWREVSTFQK